MELNLYKNGEKLEPLTYSTGDTQTDVIENVLEAFEAKDIVFLKGVVGSGKSAIGIRTALEMGGGVISVPTKMLSRQYRQDYSAGDKYFLLNDRKVNIDMIQGRRNFQCPYLEDKNPNQPSWKKTCQNRGLPCTKALAENESRLDVVNECPWGGAIAPDYSGDTNLPRFGEYRGLEKMWTLFLKRGKNGKYCPYWSQMKSYITADVVAMNSAKFKIETWMKRLPNMPLTVIDEADLFLDNISSKVTLSKRKIDRLEKEIGRREDKEKAKSTKKMIDDVWLKLTKRIMSPFESVKWFLRYMEELEWENRFYWSLRNILLHEKQCTYEDRRNEDPPKVVFFIANPRPILNEMIDSYNKVLMMSATLPSKDVLKDIFGIAPAIVKGEAKFPGKLIRCTTGDETEVNHNKWKRGNFKKKYNRTRNDIVNRMARPGFVPVHATKYLPSYLDGDELTSNSEINRKGISFSTKMDRGADLPDMNSICLLKYPFPSLGDPLLKAQKKKLGDDFWPYYRDMARRSFIQQVGRIMRSEKAEKEFWSPDLTCHKMIKKHWKGKTETESCA